MGSGRPVRAHTEGCRVANYDLGLRALCRHCSSLNATRLGDCPVCGETVCDQCGDVYHVGGEKKSIHFECRAHEESPFRMIKFVKDE